MPRIHKTYAYILHTHALTPDRVQAEVKRPERGSGGAQALQRRGIPLGVVDDVVRTPGSHAVVVAGAAHLCVCMAV